MVRIKRIKEIVRKFKTELNRQGTSLRFALCYIYVNRCRQMRRLFKCISLEQSTVFYFIHCSCMMDGNKTQSKELCDPSLIPHWFLSVSTGIFTLEKLLCVWIIYYLTSMLTIFLKLSLLTMFAGHLFLAKWSCLGVYRLCVCCMDTQMCGIGSLLLMLKIHISIVKSTNFTLCCARTVAIGTCRHITGC